MTNDSDVYGNSKLAHKRFLIFFNLRYRSVFWPKTVRRASIGPIETDPASTRAFFENMLFICLAKTWEKKTPATNTDQDRGGGCPYVFWPVTVYNLFFTTRETLLRTRPPRRVDHVSNVGFEKSAADHRARTRRSTINHVPTLPRYRSPRATLQSRGMQHLYVTSSSPSQAPTTRACTVCYCVSTAWFFFSNDRHKLWSDTNPPRETERVARSVFNTPYSTLSYTVYTARVWVEP